MVLSKRERYVVIGTVAVLVLLAVDQIVLSPYFSSRAAVTKADSEAVEARFNGSKTLDAQRKLKPIWAAMQTGGLKMDAAAAESQLLHALRDWAQESQLVLIGLRPERNATENKFQLISYRATATGSMWSISQMLWRIESASIPVRINDVEITPKKEGTDELSVQFGVSTLCQLPDDKAKPSGGSREDQR